MQSSPTEGTKAHPNAQSKEPRSDFTVTRVDRWTHMWYDCSEPEHSFAVLLTNQWQTLSELTWTHRLKRKHMDRISVSKNLKLLNRHIIMFLDSACKNLKHSLMFSIIISWTSALLLAAWKYRFDNLHLCLIHTSWISISVSPEWPKF